MDLDVTLFVRTHHDGSVLVSVVADPSVVVFAEDLEAALLDLELLLGDRFERTHPRHLHRYASPDNARFEQWWLKDGLRIRGPAVDRRADMQLSAFVSRHKEFERVFAPTWTLRAWEPKGADVKARFLELLKEHAEDLSRAELLDRHVQKGEATRVLPIRFVRAPLAAFTGRYLGLDLLPERAPTDEEGEENEKKKREVPTPMLDQVGDELTRRARENELGRAAALDSVVDELERELTSADRAAVVLVGPAGVGKSTALQELAHRLAKTERAMWFTDANRLIALRSIFGDWRGQTLGVLDDVRRTDALWYAGDAYSLLDAGKSAQSDDNVAQLLRPHLARRRVRFVAEATQERWTRLERRNQGFARLFTVVRFEEPDPARSHTILEGVATLRTAKTELTVAPGATRAAREIAERYGLEQSTHAASVGLLQRAIADRLVELDEPATLSRHDVVDTFCRESGMPPGLVRDDVRLDLDAVRAFFEERIVGQPAAIERMVDLVGLIKAGLADPGRPLGSFVFVGPTGVGKTQTAKTLAEYLFGSAQRLIRFDMGEVVSAEAVQRFIGRYGRPGKLVSEVRRTPFAVVLLDEIEKAHPAVFDVLLQVLGEGRLTDEAGRTASFRNAVVIMTSNLGAQTNRAPVGFGEEEPAAWAAHYVSEAKRFFRPELFNRLDHVVPFAVLPGPAIEGIATRELEALAARQGLRQRGLALDVPDDVATWLAAQGTDPRLGARPLKRSLEANLAAPIATHLSSMERLSPGTLRARLEDERVHVTLDPETRGDTAALGELHEAVGAVADLRRLLQGCERTRAVRDLRREIAKVERLLANPRFVKGYADLAKQLRGHGAERALLEELDRLVTHVDSLEELGYELRFARDASGLAELRAQRVEALAKLKQVGLNLAGRTVARPNQALLLLGWKKLTPWLVELVDIYCDVAAEHEWSVETHLLEQFEPDAPRQDGETLVWRWKRRAALSPEDLRSKRRLMIHDAADWRIPLLLLRVRGPHAGTLLGGEAGAHTEHTRGGDTRTVTVGHADPNDTGKVYVDAQLEPLRARTLGTPLRIVNEAQGVLEHRPMKLRFALEPRRWRLYLRAMLARVYDRTFFEGAHRVLRD